MPRHKMSACKPNSPFTAYRVTPFPKRTAKELNPSRTSSSYSYQEKIMTLMSTMSINEKTSHRVKRFQNEEPSAMLGNNAPAQKRRAMPTALRFGNFSPDGKFFHL